MQNRTSDYYYDEGRQAFSSGLDLANNPYDVYTYKYEAWREGWMDAAETKAKQEQGKEHGN